MDDRRYRPVRAWWRTLALLAVAAPGHAQVISNPNQITGSIRFTNVNPEITSALDSAAGMVGGVVTATAASASATTPVTRVSGSEVSYELSVESSAAGNAYRVSPSLTLMRGGSYAFSATCDPVFPEPAPDVRLDFADCIHLVRLHPVHADGTPAVFPRGSVSGAGRLDLTAGMPIAHVVAAGRGVDTSVTVTYLNNPCWETVTIPFRSTCDTITDAEVIIRDAGDPGTLGSLIGTLDIVGETVRSHSHQVEAHGGPCNDSGATSLSTSGVPDWRIDGLLASDHVVPPRSYEVDAWCTIRWGDRMQIVGFDRTEVVVSTGSVTDVGDWFEWDPGLVVGDITLAGPPEAVRPSWLRHVRKAGHEWFNDNSRPEVSRIEASSPGAAETADVNFVSAFSPRTESLEGDYELVLGAAARKDSAWSVNRLRLVLLGGDMADPLGFIDTTITLQVGDEGDVAVQAGVTETVDIPACVSNVRVSFQSTSGVFRAPSVRADGRLDGIDYLGRTLSRTVGATARGHRTHVADRGAVNMVLPEGKYILIPTLTTVNPGVGESVETLPAIDDVVIGCRQDIEMWRSLRVRIEGTLPTCSAPGQLAVTGDVLSEAAVTQLTWQVGSSAPIVLCAPCGISPTFAFAAPLPTGDAQVTVRAIDETGRAALAAVFTRSSPEPSALDVDPDAMPLTLRRTAPDDLLLVWEPTHHDTYAVHRGTIASLHLARTYDHVRASECDLQAAEVRIALPEADSYFLVTAGCGAGTGSYGRDSLDTERPTSLDGCP